MADFWSEEWFAAVNSSADVLPSVDGLSFSFDVEVAESANGKVRAHGQVTDGRLELRLRLGKVCSRGQGREGRCVIRWQGKTTDADHHWRTAGTCCLHARGTQGRGRIPIGGR